MNYKLCFLSKLPCGCLYVPDDSTYFWASRENVLCASQSFKMHTLRKEVTLVLLYNLNLFVCLQKGLHLGASTFMRSLSKVSTWDEQSVLVAWPAALWTDLPFDLCLFKQRFWRSCPALSSRSSSHFPAPRRTRMRRLRGRRDPGLWASHFMIWVRATSQFTPQEKILLLLWTLPPKK